MSKVITFARSFPAYHPKAGQQTDFVRKLWKGFVESELISISKASELSRETGLGDLNFVDVARKYMYNSDHPKFHTIRAGSRWKAGEYFSPRVWSGKPYNSPQIIIAPDIKIEKVWDVLIDGHKRRMNVSISGKKDNGYRTLIPLSDVAKNDGLTNEDFEDWFNKTPFIGQVICWNKNIEY